LATVPTSAAVSIEPESSESSSAPGTGRRTTRHLKAVPPTKAQREELRAVCVQVAARLDKSRPLTKDELESISRTLLESQRLPESYLGWTMVALASEFWREQVAATPPSRRLFLMPHCLKNPAGCPADYDEFGLDCRKCGACSIADFRGTAEDLGYKVLVSEGTPIVLKIIVSGHVDAIVGVACLNVLEKAIDKILLAGIPCLAVPLLSSDCRNTSVDEDWVLEMIKTEHKALRTQTSTYLHLMRASAAMFEPQELIRLAPRSRTQQTLDEILSGDGLSGEGLAKLDPVAATEVLAFDFLGQGGKHMRPFATLAVYDALTGGQATGPDGAAHLAQLPDGVRRTALSIETFHKASLVHDDIQDDDRYRYGHETLHRRFGVATAINVGDYLIGLGYRLVSREAKALGPDVAVDILDKLADAHTRLCEGQGAELFWRDAGDKQLKPLDALKIYALKTAPAFEAALACGARLAGSLEKLGEPIAAFSRHLGVAFQILNDLKDWHGDDDNKLLQGGDVLGGRPTVLWALALERLTGPDRAELLAIMSQSPKPPAAVLRVRDLYQKANVFETALTLVDKYQQRAEAVADELESEPLRRLFYYLIDTVLDRVGVVQEPPAVMSLSLPVRG